MTTRGQINSNFYQIVNVDANANPTEIKPEYITQIGNLTSLTVTGNASIGNISTGIVTATGNITAPNFIGNVIGNISGNFVVPGSNTDVLFNNDGNAGASNQFTFNKDNNTLTLDGPMYADSFFGDGAGLYNITAANVSGLGNIVTVNLDGNSGNILYGNGVFSAVPNVSNVANANYANFAGTAYSVSGSNVSGEVANANFATYSNQANTANLATYATTANSVAGANVSGTVANANYAAYAGIAGTANSVAVANVSGIGNIAVINLDGNVSNILHGNGYWGPETTSGNANYANFAGTAFSVSGANVSGEVANANYATYSGTAYSVSGANVSGDVSGANHANVADVANSVSGSNVSGDVSGANHANVADVANSVSAANITGTVNLANYATVANSVAVSNVSGIGNIATVNLTGSTSNVLFGNGVFAAIPTDDANFANFAGNVTVSAQPNITSTGNLVSLNIDNGVAGSPTKQFQPNGVSIGSTANVNLMANSSFVDIDYGNGQGGGNVLLGKSTTYLKARGNSSSLVAANVSDRVGRTNYMFYNGSANVLAVATQVNPGQGVTFNTNANAITTAGQYLVITGNPNGDQGNANALSNQNLHTFDPFGRLSITQGAAGSTSAILNLNTYGGSGGNGAAGAQGIFFQRLRGNRDGNLSVQPSDQLGSLQFTGFNGTAQFATRTAGLLALVDSSYVANTANIPVGLRFNVTDNTTSYSHNFYANGNIVLNSGKTLTAGYYYGDGSNLSNVGLGNTASGGQLTLNPTGAGAPSLTINGNSAGSNSGTLSMVDSGLSVSINGSTFPGGAPSFSFATYQTGGSIPPQFYKRYDGTTASPSGVANGDQILNQYYQVYGDSGNTNVLLGGVLAQVGNVYAPGNISFNYQLYSQNNPDDKCNIAFPTINLTGNVTANNATINSGGFMKLSTYTKTALTAITGSAGWMACVTDSASGGNPNGMIAFWDTTNSRWSYIHDNSAV